MATCSIFDPIVIDTKEGVDTFFNALENALNAPPIETIPEEELLKMSDPANIDMLLENLVL